MSTTIEQLELRARAAGFMEWVRRSTPDGLAVVIHTVPHPDNPGALTDVPDLSFRMTAKAIELWLEDIARIKHGPNTMVTFENWPGSYTVRVMGSHGPRRYKAGPKGSMAEACIALAEQIQGLTND